MSARRATTGSKKIAAVLSHSALATLSLGFGPFAPPESLVAMLLAQWKRSRSSFPAAFSGERTT